MSPKLSDSQFILRLWTHACVSYEAAITHCLRIEEILDCMRTLLFTQAKPKKGVKHELCFNIFFSFGKYLKANKFNGHQCFGDPVLQH